MLLKLGVSPEFADALDEQVAERLKRPESKIDLRTHEVFGIEPTTFLKFAQRHAAAFRGAH
jgi:hypothetical protein